MLTVSSVLHSRVVGHAVCCFERIIILVKLEIVSLDGRHRWINEEDSDNRQHEEPLSPTHSIAKP